MMNNKQLIISVIFIMTTILSYTQTTLEGKTYDALESISEADDFEKGISGSTVTYHVLTFEKDSVLISYRVERSGDIFRGREGPYLTVIGKYLYEVINQTVNIKDTMIFGLKSGEMFILTIEDEGQTLVVDEKNNSINMWFSLPFIKVLEQENVNE